MMMHTLSTMVPLAQRRRPRIATFATRQKQQNSDRISCLPDTRRTAERRSCAAAGKSRATSPCEGNRGKWCEVNCSMGIQASGAVQHFSEIGDIMDDFAN